MTGQREHEARVAEILESEARSMGRAVEYADDACFEDGRVRVVLYTTTSEPLLNREALTQLRLATYVDGRASTSIIVDTRWEAKP